FLSVSSRRHPPSPLFPYTTLFRSRAPAGCPPRGLDRTDLLANVVTEYEPLRAVRLAVGPVPSHVEHAAQARRDGHAARRVGLGRSEEHTSELQSLRHLVCRLLLEK